MSGNNPFDFERQQQDDYVDDRPRRPRRRRDYDDYNPYGHGPYGPRRSNSFGIASMILGIVAFVICLIPIVGFATVPIAALGVLLGLVGLLVACARQGAGAGFAITGVAVCGLALAVSYFWLEAFGVNDRIRQARDRANQVRIEKEAELLRKDLIPKIKPK